MLPLYFFRAKTLYLINLNSTDKKSKNSLNANVPQQMKTKLAQFLQKIKNRLK